MSADPVHMGKTWRDMLGIDAFHKRCNFALFRRGKLSIAYIDASVLDRAKMLGGGTCSGLGRGRKRRAPQAP